MNPTGAGNDLPIGARRFLRDDREKLIVAAAAVAVYLNTLYNGFLFDDLPQVVRNQWIRDVRYIPDMFFENMWGFIGERSNYYRPLLHVGYMAIYQVFGLAPWGFHLANVIMHAAVSVLVYSVCAVLFERSWGKAPERPFSASFAAAIVFATHPIHTEVVAAIMGISDLTLSLFFLLSFYLYIRKPEPGGRDLALSALSFFAALLCKEPALALPAFLISYDWLYRRESMDFRRLLKRYAPYLAAAAVYMLMRLIAIGAFAAGRPHAELSAYGYMINAFPLLKQYMVKLVLPVDLSFLYVFRPISSLSETEGIVSLALFLALAACALVAFRKSRPVFMAALFIALPLLPALYLQGLNQEVENAFAERYLYLPSFGFALLAGTAVRAIAASNQRRGAIAAVLVASLAVPYSVATVQRNKAWKDDIALFEDTIAKSPDSAYAHIFLGFAMFNEKGDVDGAIRQYEIALGLKPDNPDAHSKLGIAYLKKGWVDKAIEEHKIVLALNPEFLTAYNHLGLAYFEKGELDLALEQYTAALKISPNFIEAHNNMGLAYYRKGMIKEAMSRYRAALDLNPGFANAHNNLGVAYAESGFFDEAIWHFRETVRLDPNDANARKNLDKAILSKLRMKR